jgi:hypothetical protein
MKVIAQTPKPQPTPPRTWDLIGLTDEEMRHLRELVAHNRATGVNWDIWNAIYEVVPYSVLP